MKGFYMMPNCVFDLGLDSYELHIYSYLVSLAGKRGECWPSIGTIGRKLGVSENTALKKLDRLAQLRLIDRRRTTQQTKSGKLRRANNHYFIRPFDEVYQYHFGWAGAKE